MRTFGGALRRAIGARMGLAGAHHERASRAGGFGG